MIFMCTSRRYEEGLACGVSAISLTAIPNAAHLGLRGRGPDRAEGQSALVAARAAS